MTSSVRWPDGQLLARNSFLNLVGFGAPVLVALVAVPVLVGGLGAHRFGVLTIAWMLLAYLGELGFGSTATKFVAEALGSAARDRVGAIAWTTAAMQAALGFVEGALLFLAAPWLVENVFSIQPQLQDQALACFRLLALALPVIGVSKSFMGVLEAGQRFDVTTAIRVPFTVANYALPMLGLVLEWTLPAIFALILASRLGALLAYVVVTFRCFPDVAWRPVFHRTAWRDMLEFGGWTAISSVVSPLLLQLDRFVVGVLLSMAAVAYYAAPFEVVVRLGILPAAIVTTLYPAFSQIGAVGEWGGAARLAARAVKVILLFVGPVVLLLIACAEDGLAWWLGAEFADRSTTAVRVLALGLLVNAAAHVPSVLLHSAGRPDLPARFYLLELPLHVLLAWILVSRWGITGAAVAWTTRVTVDAGLLFAGAHRLRLLPLPELKAEKTFRLAVLTIMGVLALLATNLVGSSGARVPLVLGVLIGAAAGMWVFGVSRAERGRILTLLRGAVTP